MRYDGKGNILSRTYAGQFGYNTALPYALCELSSPASGIPMRDQHISYNAMQQPDTIIENGYTAACSWRQIIWIKQIGIRTLVLKNTDGAN